jgi:intracellular sulfur oxidation DsrE/DsrF family protein
MVVKRLQGCARNLWRKTSETVSIPLDIRPLDGTISPAISTGHKKMRIPRLAICLALGIGLLGALPALAATSDPMTAPPPAGYYVFQKVVYQNDGGAPDDHAYFERLLRNIGGHIEATDGKVEIRVVSFASGVKLFQMAKTDAGLAASVDALRAKGVRFLVCRNTLKGMGLRPEDLYGVRPEDVVPSGVAELARLQGMGFVYIHP